MSRKNPITTFGRYKKITGKSFDMYWTPDVNIQCAKPLKTWILTKSTRKGRFKLGQFKTRKRCVVALKKEL